MSAMSRTSKIRRRYDADGLVHILWFFQSPLTTTLTSQCSSDHGYRIELKKSDIPLRTDPTTCLWCARYR